MSSALADMLADNARRIPDAVATLAGGMPVTWRGHFEQSQRLASAIARLGVRRQDRIAILARNSIEYIDIFGAAQLSGLIAATVNFRLAVPEIAYVLSDSMPAVFFFEAAYASSVDALRDSLRGVKAFVCLGDAPDWAVSYPDFVASGSPDGAPFRARADDVLHLIYTSGTTGRPKGVMRTHEAELQMASIMTTDVGLLREDVVQIMMPLFHVGARWLQLGAHLRGACVILHREFAEEEVLQAIEQHRVSLTHMAPTIVQRVLEHPRLDAYDLSSLKTVYYSAAPMPGPVLRKGLERLGPVFVQLYGMTEGAGTVLHKSQHRPDGAPRERRWLSSVGQPCAGVRIRIVDDAGTPLPVGAIGEVATATPTRMSGYWNNSIATLDAMQDGWYRTGDVGYLDDEDFLFLVDRKKDMIISGGENIYCREVEEAICSHEAVAEAAVFGVPDSEWGESVKAVVVLRSGACCSGDDIVAHCRTRLASYKKPRSVVFVDTLPRLNTGKVDKKALRAAHARQDGQSDADDGDGAPCAPCIKGNS